jgi:kynurenine formamidase/predicted amidohydrolase
MIDLSVALEHGAPGERTKPKIEYVTHDTGGLKGMMDAFGVTPQDLVYSNGHGWAVETLEVGSHTATHIDAPYHYGATSEGKPARRIDEVPLEWCFGPGVVLDMRHRKPGEVISIADLRQKLRDINYALSPGDIVMIHTGAATRWGTPEYFRQPGLDRDSTLWLVEQGIHMIGIDAWTLDREFAAQIEEFKRTGDGRAILARALCRDHQGVLPNREAGEPRTASASAWLLRVVFPGEDSKVGARAGCSRPSPLFRDERPMSIVRIALANLVYPDRPEDSVALAERAIAQAAHEGAAIICFPEVYVPGYRVPGKSAPPPDAAFLERAWEAIARAAAEAHMTVVLGTERIVDDKPRITALVINADGTRAGFRTRCSSIRQKNPVCAGGWSPGVYRQARSRLACRFATRDFATLRPFGGRPGTVLMSCFIRISPVRKTGGYRPSTFADARNTFHEKAILCRAAENTCFVASVNYASEGSPTTSVVARPDGSVLAWQPYNHAGLLVVDVDPAEATGLLASRYRRDSRQMIADAYTFFRNQINPATPTSAIANAGKLLIDPRLRTACRAAPFEPSVRAVVAGKGMPQIMRAIGIGSLRCVLCVPRGFARAHDPSAPMPSCWPRSPQPSSRRRCISRRRAVCGPHDRAGGNFRRVNRLAPAADGRASGFHPVELWRVHRRQG